MHIFYHNKKCVFRKAGSKYEYKIPPVCYTYISSKVSGVANLIQWLDIQFKRLGDGKWKGVWNKALSDFWCNVKYSSSFTSKYKEIWKENLVIYQKSLKAFLHAPLQLLWQLLLGFSPSDKFLVFSVLLWVRILSQSHCTLRELLQDSQTHTISSTCNSKVVENSNNYY